MPSALICAAGAVALGEVDFGTGATGSAAGGYSSSPVVVLDTKGTATLSDDSYKSWITAPASTSQPADMTFSQLTSTHDGLGIVRRGRSTDAATGRVNTLEV